MALIAVVSNIREPLPAYDEWVAILPDWFVAACGPEVSKEEANEWLRRWEAADADERLEIRTTGSWRVTGWVYWFRPENRSWYWRAGLVENPNQYRVTIDLLSWPFAWDALHWLLEVSGAQKVCEDYLGA